MPTIREAVDCDEWVIEGKLITKYLFFSKQAKGRPTSVLLVLAFIDEDGELIEFKTWNKNKAFVVYRKVHENHTYSIQGKGELQAPSVEYSIAKYETRRWFIEPTDDFDTKKSLPCSSNVEKIERIIKQQPVNVLGVFLELIEGPGTRYINGKPTVQGYVVKLADDAGRVFYALVWHLTRIDKAKYILFNCKQGDTILLPGARLSYPPKDFPARHQLLTLTSLYKPVVNSGCVSLRRLNDLRQKFQSAGELIPVPAKSQS